MPPKLRAYFPDIQGVSIVMSRSILHEANEAFMGRVVWCYFIEYSTDHVHHFYVCLLTLPADIVSLAYSPVTQHLTQGPCMILNEYPVTNIPSVPIERELAALGCPSDHQGDEFFRILERPVIIGTIGYDHRQLIRMTPSAG